MANEKRLRQNLATGVITDNPLTTTTTVINSAGFATLPVVDSSQHMVIVLNPSQLSVPSSNAEIVYITAHSSGATVATVVRAREGSTVWGRRSVQEGLPLGERGGQRGLIPRSVVDRGGSR